jgi:hypothetical protein
VVRWRRGLGRAILLEGLSRLRAQGAQQAFVETDGFWLVFLHTSDISPLAKNPSGFIPASPGAGRLNELAAVYDILYADGTEEKAEIRRRHQVGAYERGWGENCFQSVEHHKPYPVKPPHEQPGEGWGHKQTRVAGWDYGPWINWVWAWENPHPEKAITRLRLEPVKGVVVISGLSVGDVNEQPLRWHTRRKAVFFLPPGEAFKPDLDSQGGLEQIKLDLGQVISARLRPVYPNPAWEAGYNNQVPRLAETEVLVEYTAHPQACFHLGDGRVVPVAQVDAPSSCTCTASAASTWRRSTATASSTGLV